MGDFSSPHEGEDDSETTWKKIRISHHENGENPYFHDSWTQT